MKTRIIHEDTDIIVAWKSAGLATQTARVGQQDMVSELKNHLARNSKESPYLAVIHRLDQPVEGLLVFGKNKKAAAALTAQLAKGSLHKGYEAVLCGKPAEESGTLVDYLYKDAQSHAVVVTGQQDRYPEAKKAVLHYQVLGTVAQPELLTNVAVQIETGRFHQIRAQMAHAGVPLLGDNKYGTRESLTLSGTLGVRQVALCANHLTLCHPVTGKELAFTGEPENRAFALFH
ncbi:MAG: RNA pseudouridine synthase [Lachnospiraceae bacterium]|nr:RNA pseudouridine synthase [Lachnospiraceae bacterium]